MNNNKYKELFSNTFIFALGSFGSKLISFFLVPLYTNYLTTEQYGTVDFVISCSNLLLPIVSVVIQDAVLRFGLSKEADHSKIAKNAMLVFLIGSVVTVLLTPFISIYKPLSRWGWYFCAYIISCNAENIMYSFAKAMGKNKLFAICSLIHAATLAIVNVLLLIVVPCGVSGYLAANILANCIPAFVIFFATRIPKKICSAKFDLALMKEMLIYSTPLIANNLSWWLLNSSNRIVIEHYLSVSEVGLFAAASKIPSLLSIITSIFSSAWGISSIKEYESDCDNSFFANVFSFFSVALFIGASFIILITKPFMAVYLGDEFYSSWVFVPFLVYGIVFYSISSFFGTIYGMVKKNISITLTTIVSAIINIGISISMVPVLEIYGAILATMIGYISIGIIRMIHSRKYLIIQFNTAKFVASAIVLLLQATAVSMNFYPTVSSLVGIATIIVLNINTICKLLRGLHRREAS